MNGGLTAERPCLPPAWFTRIRQRLQRRPPRGRPRTLTIDIANESGAEVSEEALAALARHVLDEMRIHPLAELSVLLVDENAMADLHQRWMGEPGPTDVLAFPMDELRPPPFGGYGKAGNRDTDPPPGLLGDVVLCPQIAAKQAEMAGHSTQDEIELLCTHGILHLLGYDHADPQERTEMFGLQERLLASWHARGSDGDTRVAGPPGGQPARQTSAREPADSGAGDDGGGQKGPG